MTLQLFSNTNCSIEFRFYLLLMLTSPRRSQDLYLPFLIATKIIRYKRKVSTGYFLTSLSMHTNTLARLE